MLSVGDKFLKRFYWKIEVFLFYFDWCSAEVYKLLFEGNLVGWLITTLDLYFRNLIFSYVVVKTCETPAHLGWPGGVYEWKRIKCLIKSQDFNIILSIWHSSDMVTHCGAMSGNQRSLKLIDLHRWMIILYPFIICAYHQIPGSDKHLNRVYEKVIFMRMENISFIVLRKAEKSDGPMLKVVYEATDAFTVQLHVVNHQIYSRRMDITHVTILQIVIDCCVIADLELYAALLCSGMGWGRGSGASQYSI